MKLPTVSLIIPCLNEAQFIHSVIQDIERQTYTPDLLEVLFVDGGSTDGTREILAAKSQENPRFQWLPNPAKYVPQAMNLGIRASKGEIIIRLDGHGAYPPHYVAELVKWLQQTGAENVGGIWETKARSSTPKAIAIAAVLAHPLGVGNSLFRLGVNQPTEVDTVPFGCYRREVFDQYGWYDERLIRNQDIELNKRIRKRGGKILLVPSISSTYYARDRFKSVWRNNYQTGRWVPLTMYYAKSTEALSLRHMIPLFFACYLLALLPISLILTQQGWLPDWVLLLLSIPGLAYLLLAGIAAIQIGVRSTSFRVGGYALIGFPLIHLAYGLGTLQGILETCRAFLGRK
jgi:glycosyltransferase involved in cell wall biosynthesis